MNWVSTLWPMIGAACLTLGSLHALIWIKDRRAWANLAFSALTVCVAVISGIELAMMRAQTPAQFGTLLRWLLVPVFGGFVTIIGFVCSYLHPGRRWLLHAAWISRLAGLVISFLVEPNLIYREIIGLRHIEVFGVSMAIADGAASRWLWLDELSVALLIGFVADASLSAWRHGAERRRALVVGGSLTVFILVAGGLVSLVHEKVIRAPYLVSFPFLLIVIVMASELSRDVLRAARLADELRKSDERMKLAADAALLGMWVWEIEKNQTWATEKCKELFGYPATAEISYEAITARVHPEDRERMEAAIRRALTESGRYDVEFRTLLPDASIHWIASTGRVDRDANGRPQRMIGIAMDISERKRTEETARELGGRLITAQEDERRRIARDLHDDLNQRLAMLSVELELYGQENPEAVENSSGRLREMSIQVRDLSSEVHRLAYQLHPAKLDQLGLVAAAGSFCREVSDQSQLPIEFFHEHVPRDLDEQASLCLYRVIQESLRNIVRHSGASKATVTMRGEPGRIKVRVVDDGRGFDVSRQLRRGGLGLVSMEERIRLLHGTISIESEPGRGTIVDLTIPVSVRVREV